MISSIFTDERIAWSQIECGVIGSLAGKPLTAVNGMQDLLLAFPANFYYTFYHSYSFFFS